MIDAVITLVAFVVAFAVVSWLDRFDRPAPDTWCPSCGFPGYRHAPDCQG